LKDKYVSRSVEDSRERKKKKSLQNKREFDDRKHKQRSRGAAKDGSETIKTKIEKYVVERQEEAECQGLKLDERGSEKRAASNNH
jgi:hypothetical protein